MSVAENVVVVAVRAEREISKTALAWAFTHVVRPGDIVTLLAVLSHHHHDAKAGWRRRLFSGFPRLGGGCRTPGGAGCQISATCSQMALQIDGRNEVNVRIKVVGSESVGAARGVVAAEAKGVGANWIVLDKNLKQEESHCMEELQCNIVVMKGSCAKVLRLNLGGTHRPCPPFSLSGTARSPTSSHKLPAVEIKQLNAVTSSNDAAVLLHRESRAKASCYSTVDGASSVFERSQRENPRSIVNASWGDVGTSGSDSSGAASPLITPLGSKLHLSGAPRDSSAYHPHPGSYTASASSTSASKSLGVYWIPQNHTSEGSLLIQGCKTSSSSSRPPAPPKTLRQKLAEPASQAGLIRSPELHRDSTEDDNSYNPGVREAVSLLRNCPSVPPPLCSYCRHKGPVFGKPPRQFAYGELEAATDGFSGENFMGEGCFGCVHRGVLEDGQVVAVKRIKVASDGDGDDEFCAEAEVLSRAQHRNVVMLVGFCVEERRRVLVYEYICNGSLDLHLHGRGKPPLCWQARTKIAVGVARGLRYLHEDCRVGFVVHRDMRPNNILLTHDFEPLVGDFSLTRWQTEKSSIVDNHLAETFGYWAPEYIEHGILTEKADLYAFGVVLLELITGRKAIDMTQPKGQQFLVDWARPLLSLASVEGRTTAIERFLDPCLDRDQARFFSQHLHAMARAASLCLRRDPKARPSMSKVLRVLEGDMVSHSSFGGGGVGSRSGRMKQPALHRDGGGGGSISYRFPNEAVANALHTERSW